jgi:hypothetical protein
MAKRWNGKTNEVRRSTAGPQRAEWHAGTEGTGWLKTHCRSIVEVVGGGQPASSAAALPSGERSPSQWRGQEGIRRIVTPLKKAQNFVTRFDLPLINLTLRAHLQHVTNCSDGRDLGRGAGYEGGGHGAV